MTLMSASLLNPADPVILTVLEVPKYLDKDPPIFVIRNVMVRIHSKVGDGDK